ncbi:unnamed protein product [Mytilus edulis]|uniref:Uncharacterized protein n=1 Tax=Mytilus edulis TaxID=6550 RepID=A0A8S3RRI5_MYTED|nr:unnamed protein product [Mytilus edulis]
MDVASDYCDNVKNERQVNTLQGTTAQVKNVHEPCQIAMQLNEGVGRVTTEPRTTRNVWIRLKQHKWSILACFLGVILTLGIVVPVMVSKSSPTKKGGQDGYLFSLKFDRKSTHSSLFMSDDNTVLGNAFTKETPNPVNHPEQFNNYKGTIGDRCFTSTTKMYFEIEFSFKILKSLNSTNLVVEVGVVSREKVDDDQYVGTQGWSFNIINCNTDICLSVTHFMTDTRNDIKIISSSNTAGTTATGRLMICPLLNKKARRYCTRSQK